MYELYCYQRFIHLYETLVQNILRIYQRFMYAYETVNKLVMGISLDDSERLKIFQFILVIAYIYHEQVSVYDFIRISTHFFTR